MKENNIEEKIKELKSNFTSNYEEEKEVEVIRIEEDDNNGKNNVEVEQIKIEDIIKEEKKEEEDVDVFQRVLDNTEFDKTESIKEGLNETIKEYTEENEIPEKEYESTEEYIKDHLLKWKQEHTKLYQTTVDDEMYIWHPLTRKQLQNIEEQINATKEQLFEKPAETEEEQIERYKKIADLKNDLFVFETVVFPTTSILRERLMLLGGLGNALSDEILLKSGFNVVSTTEL